MAFSNVFHGVTVDMCMIWKEKKKESAISLQSCHNKILHGASRQTDR